MELVIEAATAPFVRRLEQQARELEQKEQELEEKDTQLKLLTDVESKKAELERRVDAERKAAQVLHEKAEDLAKQLKEVEQRRLHP